MPHKDLWQQIHQTRPADSVSWFQSHADLSLGLILHLTAGRAGHILDVGCGTSYLVDELLGHPELEVSLLDISPHALDLTWRRLGPKAERVHWIEGDVTEVPLPERAYDIWHDRAVFQFLTKPAQRAAYVAQLRRALRPGGHVIMAELSPDGPAQCCGLPVMHFGPHSLHAELGEAFSLLGYVGEAHIAPDGSVQPYIYCHCQIH